MPHFLTASRRIGCAVTAIVVVVALAPAAHAKLKPHCRRLSISGNAGPTPNQATFQILDKNSNTLALSCSVQPWSNETAIDYIERLTFRWSPDPTNTDFDNDPCTPIPVINDPLDLPDRLPKKACVTLGVEDSPSCTIKYKIAPKGVGTKKQYVEICCYEDNDDDKLCKTKLDPGVLPKPIPITIQVDTNGDTIYCPLAPCDGNCPECPIVDITPPLVFGMRGPVEPLLGTKHLPSATGGGCRADLGTALYSYAREGSFAISRCHKARLAEKISAASECNSVSDDPGTEATFDALADGIASAALDCAEGGSPASSGYATCPPPCSSLNLKLCSAGNVGAPCEGDSDCDLIPGDGLCGDWAAAGDCLVCLAENAVVGAALTTYGSTPVPIPPPADIAKCHDAIARALTKLTATLVGATTKCQKKADAGQSLPAGVSLCKDADEKGAIAKTEIKTRDLIAKSCGGGEIPLLASICGGALDPNAVGDCVVENAHAVNDAISGAAFPETVVASCGDGVKSGSEQCDGADDAACPGACLASCQCGLLSPVTENLVPCQPGSIDRYTFPVQAGDALVVRADTVNLGTAADLCFGLGSGCDNGDDLSGDDEVPCTFPSPLGFGCPQAALSASADGVCTVEVAECLNDCADAGQAVYSLSVKIGGSDIAVELTADDEPE